MQTFNNWYRIIVDLIEIIILNLNNMTNIVQVTANFVQILAITLGGLWAIYRFGLNRKRYPCADISHYAIYKSITADKSLLRVVIIVVNRGEVLLSLSSVDVYIQQIMPWPNELISTISQEIDPVGNGHTEVEWPLIADRCLNWENQVYEIEPGETDEFHFDFIIDSEVKTFMVYSHFSNDIKKNIGWNKTSIYDVEDLLYPKHENWKEDKKVNTRLQQNGPKSVSQPSPNPDGTKQGPKKEKPPVKPKEPTIKK